MKTAEIIIGHWPASVLAEDRGFSLRCRCGAKWHDGEPETLRSAWATHVAEALHHPEPAP